MYGETENNIITIDHDDDDELIDMTPLSNWSLLQAVSMNKGLVNFKQLDMGTAKVKAYACGN